MEKPSEQPNRNQSKVEADNISNEDFEKLSLEDMEKKLSTPTKDQDSQDSETSERKSETNETEEEIDQDVNDVNEEDEVTEEEEESEIDNEEENEDSSASDSEKDKQKKMNYKKSYENLLPEYTRSRQEIKDLKNDNQQLLNRLKAVEDRLDKPSDSSSNKEKPTDSNSKLAALKEKNPEVAEFLESVISEEVGRRVDSQVKPIEDKITQSTQESNFKAFSKAVDKFKTSDLGPLADEIAKIYSENESHWEKEVFTNPNAFSLLEKELVYRNLDKVSSLRSKSKRTKSAKKAKAKDIENADVGNKTNKDSSSESELSDKEFEKLSLEEMEKRLPKLER